MVIILPVYNEGERLNSVLKKLTELHQKGQDFKILVINDGSTDNTEEIVRNYGVSLITHHQNKGLGKSLFDGFLWAISKNEDIAITMDGDDTMDVSLIPKMQKMIKQDGYELVIASRYASDAEVLNVPFYRKIISFVSSLICRMVFAISEVRDFSSGYRAYDVHVLKNAYKKWKNGFITSSTFDCQLEILWKIAPFVGKIAEIGIKLNYEGKIKKSHFKFFKTFIGYWKQLFLALRERFA